MGMDDSTDGRIERAKDKALGSHDSNPSHFDEAGEGLGGITGALTGAAIGTAGGPIGTIIGGIAGAIGGWWAGRAVTEAASALTSHDDEHFRTHYDHVPGRPADRSYDDVRPAYHLGHIASRNPDYARREWNDVAGDLQRGWSVENARKHGDWGSVSRYASEGFNRGRATQDTAASRTADSIHSSFDRVVPSEERR